MIDLKKMRKELGLTQEAVADVLGITKSTWNMIENGKANLTERNKSILIEKLNINPKYLADGTEPIVLGFPPRDTLISQALTRMEKLNDSNRQIVLDLITSLENNNVFKDDD